MSRFEGNFINDKNMKRLLELLHFLQALKNLSIMCLEGA